MDQPTAAASEASFPPELRALIRQSMKYKERSHNTFLEVHKPGLEAIPLVPNTLKTNLRPSTSTASSETPPTIKAASTFDVIFIGDSMLERLKTTGINTNLHNLQQSFNLGVGGDRIQNVLYRLDLGYIELLGSRHTRLWVVHIGTNDLTPKRGLRNSEISCYRLLLQALLNLSPESQVLVTGLFKRKDVSDEIVEKSNEAIQGLVEDLNGQLDGSRLVWLAPTDSVTKEMLVDHVHLTEEGYDLWDEDLCPRVLETLAS